MVGFFLLFVVAAVLALAGFYVAVAVRRWTQREETVANFTFQDLRDMKARGEITEPEFKAMRAAVLAQVRAVAEDAGGTPPPGAGPEQPGQEPPRPETNTPDGTPPTAD